MTLFGQRRRLRHLAAQMLLAWLFALASGVVSACIAGPAPCHGAAHPRHAQACAKFCADSSTGVQAQAAKQQLDRSPCEGLAPPPTAALAVAALPRQDAALAADEAHRRPAIPIPIAFLRLTL